MCNKEIRVMLTVNNIKHWEVADSIGIAEGTFSRWLRKELPEEKKEAIIKAINELKERR